MPTQGIHLIWSTYGSWLPGDARGHWSPLFDIYGRLRQRGHQLNLPDDVTRSQAKSRLQETPRQLDLTEQIVVGCAIAQLARDAGEGAEALRIIALAVEPEHVHLLIGPTKTDIAELVGRIKSRTSSLLRRLPAGASRRRTWTTGYWKVFLFDQDAVAVVRAYIEAHNVRRGLSPDRFECADKTI